MVFIFGFIIGNKLNESGRYVVFGEITILDSKTGKIFLYNQDTKMVIEFDFIEHSRKENKVKNIKCKTRVIS